MRSVSLRPTSIRGALLAGCNAGTLDFARIKGIHTPMKSGMVSSETIHAVLASHRDGGRDLVWYDKALRRSWAGRDLYRTRNFHPALKKFGPVAGGAFSYLDQSLFRGYLPFTLRVRA